MLEAMSHADSTAAGFAAARAQFHRLVELDAEARERELDALAVSDPALADAVRRLFGHLDVRDLEAPACAMPERLGPFRPRRLIGRGGMGEVYAAERVDGAFEQQVALKLIRTGQAGLGLDARFLRERQILARLEHPHIARLIDGGLSEDGQPWLAMELVDGVDLATWVGATRADLQRRIALFVRICDAVAFAHRALVVHRDLKPANVMVDAHDQPRLLDFGIAKLLEEEGAAPTQTVATGLTLRYAAPEQVLGDRTTTATDVYALGVVLFELVARRSPYRAADAVDAPWRDAILSGDVHALGDVLDDALLVASDARRAAQELAAVVRKAMALSPTDRYNGAAALADDLRDWLAQRPFRSGIGTMSARVRLQLRRWRWPIFSAVIATAALVVGGVVALQQAARAREEAAVAEANMQGMLDVLGELEVLDYTEPDPPLSKALVAAGARLQREHADHPAFLWRALGALGRTLYNRHRPDLAAPLLRATEEALARDPQATPRQRFDFAVMRYSADAPTDAATIAAQAARIGVLAARTDAENRLSEIATSAYGLSLYGKSEAALALVRAVDTSSGQVDAASRAVRDDYFVRRGDIEWRAGEFGAARLSYGRVDGRDPATAAVDAVQVLRMQALLALDDGDLSAAKASIAAAQRRADGQALRPGDAERLALTRVRIELADGDTANAQSILNPVLATFRTREGSRHVRADLRSAAWLQAAIHARHGHCRFAHEALAEADSLLTGPAVLPAVLIESKWARAAVTARCPFGGEAQKLVQP
jgi:serine/threonine-protein kinase